MAPPEDKDENELSLSRHLLSEGSNEQKLSKEDGEEEASKEEWEEASKEEWAAAMRAMEKKRRHHFCRLLSGVMSLASITLVICSASTSSAAGGDTAWGKASPDSKPNVADCSAAAARKAIAMTTSTESNCNLPQVGEIKNKFDFTLSQKSAKIRDAQRDHQLVASLPVPYVFGGHKTKNVR